MIKRPLLIACGFLIATVLGTLSYGRFRSNLILLAIQAPQPYTIEQTERITCRDPKNPSRISDRRSLARSTSGDTLSQHDLIGSAGHKQSEIHLSTGIAAKIFHNLRLKSTYGKGIGSEKDAYELSFLNPKQDCLYQYDGQPRPGKKLGEEIVHGFRTIKIVEDGHDTWTTWRAPGLGCVLLQQEVIFRDSKGGFVSNSILTTDSVLLGEPSANLFVIPFDYREVPMGSLSREQRIWKLTVAGVPYDSAREQASKDTGQEAFASKLDSSYLQNRQRNHLE